MPSNDEITPFDGNDLILLNFLTDLLVLLVLLDQFEEIGIHLVLEHFALLTKKVVRVSVKKVDDNYTKTSQDFEDLVNQLVPGRKHTAAGARGGGD